MNNLGLNSIIYVASCYDVEDEVVAWIEASQEFNKL